MSGTRHDQSAAMATPNGSIRDNHDEKSNHSQTRMSLRCAELHARSAHLLSELEKAKSENSQLKLDMEDLRIDIAEKIQYWKQSCSDSRKWERRNKNLQVLLAKKSEQDLIKKILSQHMEYERLNDSFISYKAGQDPKAASWRSFQNPDIRVVISKLEELRDEIKEVSQGPSAIFSLMKVTIGKHTDLAVLTQRSFSLQIPDGGLNATATAQLCGMRLRDIFASLLSAAVCMWVFETDIGVLFHGNNHAYSNFKSLVAAHGT